MGRLTWIVTVAAFVALMAWGWMVLPPDGIVMHQGLDGEPTRYGGRGEFFAVWGGLAVVLFVLTPWGVLAATRGEAAFLNLPNKDYWLQPERREETFATVRTHLWFFLAATNLLMVLMLVDTITLSTWGEQYLGIWPLVAYLVGTVAWLVVFSRRFRIPDAG